MEVGRIDRFAFTTQMNPSKKKIISVSVVQAGLVLGGLYALISLLVSVVLVIIGLVVMAGGGGSSDAAAAFGGGIGIIIAAVLAPFIYGALGFIGGVIVAAVYNLIAKFTGGIEVTVVEVM